jgi:hypothetical protein
MKRITALTIFALGVILVLLFMFSGLVHEEKYQSSPFKFTDTCPDGSEPVVRWYTSGFPKHSFYGCSDGSVWFLEEEEKD